MPNRIKELRESRGIKQVDLAVILNISQGTLSNWERNIHDLDNTNLNKLADFFDVTTDYLLGRHDNFHCRIKELRLEREMSLQDVADRIGVSPSDIEKWETGGRSFTNTIVKKLSSLFYVSDDYLLGYVSEPFFHLDNKRILDELNTYSEAKNALGIETKGVRINVYGSVAAGVPIEALEDIVEWEDIPSEWVRGGREYFGLIVKGDSMYPKYVDGDIVIVRKTSDFASGHDCVVYVNGYDATLKTIRKHKDGSIELIPYNREYPPKKYTKDELSELPIVICGVVVELRRKV